MDVTLCKHSETFAPFFLPCRLEMIRKWKNLKGTHPWKYWGSQGSKIWLHLMHFMLCRISQYLNFLCAARKWRPNFLWVTLWCKVITAAASLSKHIWRHIFFMDFSAANFAVLLSSIPDKSRFWGYCEAKRLNKHFCWHNFKILRGYYWLFQGDACVVVYSYCSCLSMFCLTFCSFCLG